MKPLATVPAATLAGVRAVLTDIDDTLSTDGRILAQAYGALERLHRAGFLVVPVTGRPAGWCDHIARMWPVDAVVGENGAFYMRHERAAARLKCVYALDEDARRENRRRLDEVATRILAEVPGTALASDQRYRVADIAIDYCEDVPALDATAVRRIVSLMEAEGLTAKVSSIHVNGWIGSYDKLTMSRELFAREFALDLDAMRAHVVFVGDSPNDAPMFDYFPLSVGVANVTAFAGAMSADPKFVTTYSHGKGFAEVADTLLIGGRRQPP